MLASFSAVVVAMRMRFFSKCFLEGLVGNTLGSFWTTRGPAQGMLVQLVNPLGSFGDPLDGHLGAQREEAEAPFPCLKLFRICLGAPTYLPF